MRAVLGILGGVQVLNGLYALLAPSSFFGDFPLGRGWVAALPAYNEHLVRDVGSLFLATGIVLLAAVVWTERRLVLIALVSYLAFALPHAIYHAFNLEPYGAGDAIANAVTLAFTVLAPIALLVAMLRGPRCAAAGRATAAGGADRGRARVTRNPLVRFAYRDSRRRDGTVIDPLRIYAHHPTLLAAYGAFELGTERAHAVPERLKHLAELRAAMLAGCEWCLDYGSAISTAADVGEEDMRALPGYDERPFRRDREAGARLRDRDEPDAGRRAGGALRCPARALRRGPAGRADQRDRPREPPRPLQLGFRPGRPGLHRGRVLRPAGPPRSLEEARHQRQQHHDRRRPGDRLGGDREVEAVGVGDDDRVEAAGHHRHQQVGARDVDQRERDREQQRRQDHQLGDEDRHGRPRSGGGIRSAPASASSASAAPTAMKPMGRIATTTIREISTSTSGAKESGAKSAAMAAYRGRLRAKKEPVRSRAPVPARVPNAAPTAKAPISSAGA